MAIIAIHPPPQALELAPNGETTRQPLVATGYIDAQSSRFTKIESVKLSDLGLVCRQHNYEIHPVSIKPPIEVTNFKLKASNIEFMDTLLQRMKTFAS